MTEERIPVYCDCHGTEIMGYKVDGNIIWFDERHGERHFKAVNSPSIKVEIINDEIVPT